MQTMLEYRIAKLERRNCLLLILIGVGLLIGLMQNGSLQAERKIVRAEKLEIVDAEGKVIAMLGSNAEGSRGLFIYDDAGIVRTAAIHDTSQSAFYAYDTTATIRVGLAQFAHGGGGLALHGEHSKGAAVLYYKNGGSLRFFDSDGTVLLRVPEK